MKLPRFIARFRVWLLKRKTVKSLKCPACAGKKLESHKLWWTDKSADIDGFDSGVLLLQMHCNRCSFTWNHTVFKKISEWPGWFIKAVNRHGDQSTNTIP